MMKLSFSQALNLKPRTYALIRLVGLYSATAPQEPPPAFAEPGNSLHLRITPHLDPTVSITPVLDQWVEEGKTASMIEIHQIINELRRYRRFKHALEVSEWMSDKMKYKLNKGDVAVRFELISKVHGPEQAEKFINNFGDESSHVETYAYIIRSYTREKSVEKAETVMNKLRELGLRGATICYNAMISLYRQINNREKIEALICEMEYRDVKYDKFTFCLLLGTYGDASDIEGLERVLQKMEFATKATLDSEAYSVAANCFIKAGLFEKASVILKKSEDLITSKNESNAFVHLLSQYAAIGKRDEVFRIWELMKQKNKLENKNYVAMVTSLVKLDDLESAEVIFDEWESSDLSYDFKITNLLIGAYCKKGLVEKAEAFIERAKIKGEKPLPYTFYYLATGYIVNKEMDKAVEAMKMALLNLKIRWRPSIASVDACFVHLKEKGDVEEANEFLKLLKDRDAISADMYSTLSDYMKKG